MMAMHHYRSCIPKLLSLLQAEGMLTTKYFEGSTLRGKISTSLFSQWSKARDRRYEVADLVRRYRVARGVHHDLCSQADIVTFINSSLHKSEGPDHYWLNDRGGSTKGNQHGIFIMLLISVSKDLETIFCPEYVKAFQRVKLLQQRYPELNVLAICFDSLDSIADHARILEAVMDEYVTFPILLLKKDCMKLSHNMGFLLSKGSMDQFVHFDLDVDLAVITKAIEEYSLCKKENELGMQDNTVHKPRQQNILKEPYFNPFRNLLFCHPASVAVDEDGNRLFISDSNHHRIIICNGEGKILDCIGSSPGFEDGEFESAKLFRPAGSFYQPSENCLYFVDSEILPLFDHNLSKELQVRMNHAIRRAHMEKRAVETIYPPCVWKSSGVWGWILDKLGLGTKLVPENLMLDLDLIRFPWYLMKLGENELLTLGRSFDTLWVVSLETGDITRIVRGVSNIMEMCREQIKDKLTLLKDTYQNISSRRLHQCLSFEEIPFSGLLPSIANFRNDIILCNAASQRILRYNRESRGISYLQFSNLGVLGLPYWMVSPLERVINSENKGNFCEHLQHSSVLPGRCNIGFYVNIPQGTELVAPLDESCIWCQARGSAVELSMTRGSVTGAQKVGVAQQWFDELDNLAYSDVENESSCQDESHPEVHFQDDRLYFDCAINISPGTAEVVVSAVLYLKLKKTNDDIEEQRLLVRRVLGYSEHEMGKLEQDASIRLLSDTIDDVEDVVFMKPLNIRLRIDCADHPTAKTNKETICTDSTLQVPISME